MPLDVQSISAKINSKGCSSTCFGDGCTMFWQFYLRRSCEAMRSFLVFQCSHLMPSSCQYCQREKLRLHSFQDVANNEEPVPLPCNPDGPLVALAFKLEEGRFGQLTYMRIYSGTIRKGDYVINTTNGKKMKVGTAKLLSVS